MTERLIPALDAEQRRDFGKTPLIYAHRLLDTGLFEDEALARQLERHPADLFDINVFHYDDNDQAMLQTGAKGRRGGDQLLKAVKAGRVWIQLRRIQDHDPELAEAMAATEAELPSWAIAVDWAMAGAAITASAAKASILIVASPCSRADSSRSGPALGHS